MKTVVFIASFLVSSSHDDDQTCVNENRWFWGVGVIVESVQGWGEGRGWGSGLG